MSLLRKIIPGFRLIDGDKINAMVDILNGVSPFPGAGVKLTGSTSGSTTLKASAVASGTLTLPAATDTLVGKATTDTLTNKTLTSPVINGALINNAVSTGPVPIGVGASLVITSAHAATTYLLNTAGGSTATLPAATGTGNKYRFDVTVTTTSAAHQILAASSSDFIIGMAIGETSGTCKAFPSPGATNHSIQMPFTGSQPSGGFIGDYFEFQDIGTNLWYCSGMYQAGTTPTSPFSTATS